MKRPSVISLPEGIKAYATRVEGKRVIQPENLSWFNNNGGRLLLSYENYSIDKFSSSFLNRPAVNRFGDFTHEMNFLVLRNPFNMLPSAEKMLRRTMHEKGKNEEWVVATLNKRLLLWKSYAFLHLYPNSVTRGKFSSFLFDSWMSDKNYRDAMAEKLNYVNHDRFLDFVSDAGKGSSFTGNKISQKNAVLNRWEGNDSMANSMFEKHPEVIDYTAVIFGEDSVPERFLRGDS